VADNRTNFPVSGFVQWLLLMGVGSWLLVWLLDHHVPLFAQEASKTPPTVRMMCGACPEGYVMTGATDAPDICKEDEPLLVQCVPLGATPVAVCGSCPEGYVEVGQSSVPSRCGGKDGGRLTHCQLQKMEPVFPDPNQGMKSCPPDCGATGVPGAGVPSPPPRYQRTEYPD
jgi:hypothetical protein